MADSGVIIKADLKEEDLTRKIDKLVQEVDSKFSVMAQKIDDNVQLIKMSLGELGSSAQSRVSEIKQAFTQLGTTFDQFARAMERAASAASGVGGRGGSGTVTGSGSSSSYPDDSIGKIKSEVKEWEKLRDQLKLYDADLKVANNEIERLKGLLKEATKGQLQLTREARNTNKARERQYMRDALSMEIKDIQDAERKLNRLNGLLQRNQNTPLLNESQINRIKKAITATTKELERLKLTQATPQTMVSVMGMSEKTLDDIALKMKAISTLRANTSIGNKDDINQLNTEYARLSKLQSEVLGKTQNLVESNNSLGRAFNYIKNRLAFMLTVGAFTGFVRQLYEVRGQYELLERSLGVLLNSFSRGQQVFQELNAMAIKSPFTLIELGTAAKQLTAYNFKASEVVNTTKRMADIAAAVGVPMERLVYNLGQIRAQTVLTARDARDFANAGLPIVSSLADMYSKLEGRVVSTGDVFDRMKKKAVSYNDVMTVINQMTDEGGKFFDFQAKQAGTLKVQLANLTLAWNNMLNSIGESNQGLLSAPVQAMKALFQNWKEVSDALTSAAIALGAYKVTQMAVNRLVGISATQLNGMIMAENRSVVAKYERIKATRALTQAESAEYVTAKMMVRNKQFWIASDYELALAETKLSTNQAMRLVMMNKTNVQLHKALINMRLLTQAELDAALATSKWVVFGKMFMFTLQSIGRSIKSLLATAWPLLLITAISEIIFAFSNANDQIEDINRKIRETAKETADALRKFSDEYSSIRQSLYKYDDNGNQVGTQAMPQDEAKKAWDTMRSKIEESISSANTFIAELENINDINERLRRGFGLIDSLTDAQGKMESLKDDAIDVGVTTLGGLFGEGLKRDLQDYIENLSVIIRQYGDVKKAQEELDNLPLPAGIGNVLWDLQEINNEISKVTDSMAETFISDKFNFDIDQQRLAFEQTIQSIADKQELSADEVKTLRIKAEHEYYESAKAIYESLLQTQQGEARKVTEQRLKDLKEEFNTNKSMQETFFQWLSDTRSSETQKMLQNMTREELAAGKWMNDQNIKWIQEQAKAFSKEYGISFDDLWSYVQLANTWKIYIPVYFQNIGNLTDFQQTMKAAGIDQIYYQNAESTVGVLSELKKRQKDVAEEISASTNAKKKNVPYSQTYIDSLNSENESLTQQIHNLNGLTDAEEKAFKERQKNAKKNTSSKRQKQAEDEVAKALKNEISIIKEMQSSYDKLRKAGVGTTDALTIASSGYDKTLKSINAVLSKYGISPFKAEDFVGSSDPHKLLTALQNQLDTLIKSGKVKTASLKDLEMEIQKITVSAKEYDMKKITDGLNNELGKIKEEYELAVELDANPELGDMFADMFGIDVDDLPHTFGEAYDKANKVAISKLKELKADVDNFDLMSINLTKFAEKQGIGIDSTPIQDLMKLQKTWRDMFKKNLTETEKYLDDYVKKYGNMSDKIAEIEAERLHRIKQLNEAYFTEQMRKMPEYAAKLAAINKGAEREKGGVRFDEFKNSRLYVTMFENLQYVSTATLETIRQKLIQLKSEMGTLTPEQLKQVVQQFEKIDDELRKRSPFKGLVKNYKDYIKAIGKAGKQAEKDLVVAQEKYDQQLLQVTALKEELEQKKASNNATKKELDDARVKISSANAILELRKKELDDAIKLNEQYNLMKKIFGTQWQTLGKVAQVVSTNLKSLGELRDYLKDAGVDFGDAFDGVVDSLQGVSEGMNQIVSSATSGDVFGVVTGTIKTVFGIGDAIAGIFGDGAARTRRLNREIKESQEEVRRLNMAYKDLERTVNKAMGSQEIAAQRALIANKKMERDEIERQLRLEKSKRSKDRDEDAIKQYEETLQSLNHEIEDLSDSIVENLLGNNVKSAAEDFVDTWVSAWKEGENTLDAIQGKMDDVIQNLIKKAVASKVVGTLLQPFYNAVDQFASEQSEGGVSLTLNELKALSEMANTLGININDALTALFANFESLGIIDKSGANAQLSALQQGIQGITEDTASALEAYMNGVSQQVYYQSDILTQIRDILVNFGGDVTIATNAQILFELQQSYQVQMSIQSILQGWSNASGLAVRVELAN